MIKKKMRSQSVLLNTDGNRRLMGAYRTRADAERAIEELVGNARREGTCRRNVLCTDESAYEIEQTNSEDGLGLVRILKEAGDESGV